MKFKLLFVILLGLCISSCATRVKTNGATVPPGQVKKITGSQSARDYAPGHNK